MAAESQQPNFGEEVPDSPAVPEILDPEMEEFKQQLASAYHIVMTDPRYTRTVKKIAPSFFSKEGLKKQVDPSKIPVFGMAVKGYRSARIEKHKSCLEETQKTGSTSSLAMNTTVSNMEHNMNAEAKKRHIGLAVGIAFSIVPISTVVPVGQAAGGAAGGVAGQAGAQVATKGTEKGLQTGIKKGAQKAGESTSLSQIDTENFESKVHKKFSYTKAFLIYLGAPKTDDELYARWETARMLLKTTYGAKEEEDLAQMEPTDAQKKEMEAIEKDKERTYDFEAMGVSLLWVFWRMYECWDLIYFDYLDEKRHGSKENREKFLREQRAKERAEDVLFLQGLCISQFPTVRKVHKNERDFVIEMLLQTYMDHPIITKFFELSKPQEKKDLLKFFWGTIVDNFFNDQEIWAIEDSNLQIHSVALLKPAENKPTPPLGKVAMAKITKKIGLRKAKDMTFKYQEREKIAANHVGVGVQVICYIGNETPQLTEDSSVASLCKSLIKRNDAPPTFVHEKGGGPEWVNFWESCGMKKKLDVMKGEHVFWHQN